MNEKPNIYVLSDLHFDKKALPGYVKPVSYTHLTLPTTPYV